jgi:hypothetical protein
VPIHATGILLLKLKKPPSASRRAFRMNNIHHNFVAVSKLVDAGCSVHMYFWGFEIDYEGETIYKGWREKGSRLFRMDLNDTRKNRITPTANPAEYNTEYNLDSGTICQSLNWSANNIHECKSTEQLIKYNNASLGLHPKRTLPAAASAGYLQGCPGLTAKSINRHIGVECAT